MTKNNLTRQFYLFLLQEKPWDKMQTLFEVAIESDAINADNEPAESFRLAAIIYHAILSEMVLRATPREDTDLIESEYLQRFL